MDGADALRALTPSPPSWEIDWRAVESSLFGSVIADMKRTAQDPVYHGEGDVWTHTQMVCRALADMTDFRTLPRRERQLLFCAALLHDVGKPACTRQEGGRLVSPHHAAAGARLARRLLWLEAGLCGTPDAQSFREAVCALIRWHTKPPHLAESPDAERQLRALAAVGELAGGFSLRLLCMLARADVLGRQCADREQLLEQVGLCAELARQAACWDGPFAFPDGYTRFAYLSSRRVPAQVPLYDPTWGPVILLSGLPGTGKDTWIGENCPSLPHISLDQARRTLGIMPQADQAPAAEYAREQARALLRRRQSFVWNATDLSQAVRRRQLALFHAYGASVRIVYLETTWDEQMRRNRAREAAVPEERIVHMLDALDPPGPEEARQVQWLCL